ncbi:MAG: LysR family transcriptional regulator, partial [Alphaproteobacteria bacterium]|nr:LysR family transcriptional regulator [Alphaproteobacteria bacterium]
MRNINLPTDILRAFISVIDLGGFTRAAEALGRTQPAISLQMRRLEDLVGAKLIVLEGRELKLTEPGEALAMYARQLLRLNDEAVAHFAGRTSKGTLRIGLPTDFAVAYLQEVISDFARAVPAVEIEVHCELSWQVLERLHSDEIDIAIGILNSDGNPYLVRSWEERPIWVAARNGEAHLRTPVPLASHPEGCEYRSRMIAALRAVERDWRIVYTNPGISGLQRAVSTGLGVSVLTRKTLLPDMRVLDAADGFPGLQTIR